MAAGRRQIFSAAGAGGWPVAAAFDGAAGPAEGMAGPAVPSGVDGVLAGDHREWEYDMRRDMQEVIPGVFLGPWAAARKDQLGTLQAAGITHIVCVRQSQKDKFVRPNFPDKFEYLTVDVADDSSENIIVHLPLVRDFIDHALDAGGRVLLHGRNGMSRSGSLLIAYIMYKLETSFSEALRLVQKRRFCVAPNEGFQAQLHEYEPIYRAELMQRRMVDDGGGRREAPPKRTFDEYDDMEDYVDEHAMRNPAYFPPSEPMLPLAGHSAHVRSHDAVADAMEPA